MSLVCCPHCEHPVDMTCCEVYHRHVTYWGEEVPVERECDRCSKSFFLKEHVRRTWSVGVNLEYAEDLFADEHGLTVVESW